MDLKAVHAKLGELLNIDALAQALRRPGTLAVANVADGGTRTTILSHLSDDEWAQILNQRRARVQDELRRLGFVAAHDGSAPTLRQFRDRQTLDTIIAEQEAKARAAGNELPKDNPNGPGFP